MTKQEVKSILMSMRNQENEALVNNLLGKIDMMKEEEFGSILEKLGNEENRVKSFLKNKLVKMQEENKHGHIPINEMFTYGISGNRIHLHLPGDLHQMKEEKGISYTMDIIYLQMLDAIDRIKKLRDDGFYKFQGKDSIYMISPILNRKSIRFLESLDFETHSYKRGQLSDDKFVEENGEAKLAISIFGRDKNIGTASIDFDTMSTKEWQEKRKLKVKEFEEKGIVLKENTKSEK